MRLSITLPFSPAECAALTPDDLDALRRACLDAMLTAAAARGVAAQEARPQAADVCGLPDKFVRAHVRVLAFVAACALPGRDGRAQALYPVTFGHVRVLARWGARGRADLREEALRTLAELAGVPARAEDIFRAWGLPASLGLADGLEVLGACGEARLCQMLSALETAGLLHAIGQVSSPALRTEQRQRARACSAYVVTAAGRRVLDACRDTYCAPAAWLMTARAAAYAVRAGLVWSDKPTERPEAAVWWGDWCDRAIDAQDAARALFRGIDQLVIAPEVAQARASAVPSVLGPVRADDGTHALYGGSSVSVHTDDWSIPLDRLRASAEADTTATTAQATTAQAAEETEVRGRARVRHRPIW